MKKIALTFLFLGTLSAVTLTSAEAAAEGLIPVKISAKEREALKADVVKAKAASPRAFAQLAELRAAFPQMDKEKRGRFAPITPVLAAIGPEGLYPMLEQLLLSNDPHADMTDGGFVTWRAGLLEGVGKLRDGRALPYLTAALETGPVENDLVIEAAGRAVGRLRSTEAIASLERASRVPARKLAAIAGLGEARRAKSTTLLATMIDEERTDGKTMRALLKALGTAGGSWAWDTLGGATTGEGDEVRLLAARALLDAWLRLSGEAREEAYVQLSMTEHRDLPSLIEKAKGRAGVDREALAKLGERMKSLRLR